MLAPLSARWSMARERHPPADDPLPLGVIGKIAGRERGDVRGGDRLVREQAGLVDEKAVGGYPRQRGYSSSRPFQHMGSDWLVFWPLRSMSLQRLGIGVALLCHAGGASSDCLACLAWRLPSWRLRWQQLRRKQCGAAGERRGETDARFSFPSRVDDPTGLSTVGHRQRRLRAVGHIDCLATWLSFRRRLGIHWVAKMLEKLRIKQIKSRSRHCNGRAASPRGETRWPKARGLGASFIAIRHAGQMRSTRDVQFLPQSAPPRLFATSVTNAKGGGVKRDRHVDARTPLASLTQLSANHPMREGLHPIRTGSLANLLARGHAARRQRRPD